MLEFLFEVLLQMVFEVLAEAGLWFFRKYRTKRPGPGLAAVGYAFLGIVCGLVSLLVFPALLLRSPTARLLNLLVTPLVAGAAMALLAWWWRRREQPNLRAAHFVQGFLFAFAMALVRYFVAR